MNTRDNDDLHAIPTMKPARDELMRPERRSGKSNHRAGGGSSSLLTVLALLVAVAALGASYFLWEQSRLTQQAAQSAEARIAELESQLVNTGDELTQSDAAVRVKLKELDSEVRKLWDSRKKARTQAQSHDSTIKNLTTRTSTTRKKVDSVSEQLTVVSAELDDVIEKLGSGDLAADVAQLKTRMSELQSTIADAEQLEARVKANEEWVESINAFRRQVNARLNQNVMVDPAQPQLQ